MESFVVKILGFLILIIFFEVVYIFKLAKIVIIIQSMLSENIHWIIKMILYFRNKVLILHSLALLVIDEVKLINC